jgi:ribosomal protein S2
MILERKNIKMNQKVEKTDEIKNENNETILHSETNIEGKEENRNKKRKERIVKQFLPTEIEELKELVTTLMSCGAHFGHSSAHPTSVALAKDKINGCNIIDLKYTIISLGEVLNRIYHIISDGGKILFVTTSHVADLFKKTAEETGQSYITGIRYRPGLLTNFSQFLTQIRSLDKFKKQIELEAATKSITKKEQRVKNKQLAKSSEYLEGLLSLKELPKMVIVIGNAKEYEILKKEAESTHVFFVSISDINVETLKSALQTSICCNTQSKETVEFILRYISQAILEGYEKYIQVAQKHVSHKPNEKIPFKKRSQKEVEDKIMEDILLDSSKKTTTTKEEEKE